MKNALIDSVAAFKLVWIRVACYFVIPFVTTFLAQTETWSQDTWDHTGNFLITRLFMSCFISGITSFVAYLDSSFQKARAEATDLRAKREAQTDFTAKQQTNETKS